MTDTSGKVRTLTTLIKIPKKLKLISKVIITDK